MECPKCHSIIDDNQKVCPICNKVLLLECPNCKTLGDSAVCTKCGYTILVKCSKCSKITPFEKGYCSKCKFPLATSLAYQECETDEFASLVIKFNSLKRIKKQLKSQDLYTKFINKIKNLLLVQFKGLDCKIINYNDTYEVNFNKELSFATSSHKAVRLALKIINAFVLVNDKIIEEMALPLNLHISIHKKYAENLQEFFNVENNVKLLATRKNEKKYLKGFQITLDQFVRDEVNKDYKTDSLFTLEENGNNITYYEILLDKYILPPDTKTEDIIQVQPKQIKKDVEQDEKDLYSFKFFDINAKCHFERTNATGIWEKLNTIKFENGGKIISLRSKPEHSLSMIELETYFNKQDLNVLRVCCTEGMNYEPWGFFKTLFREYFNLPLIKDIDSISKIDEQILKFNKPLFDLYFDRPVKAGTPEDARFTYMEYWSKFLRVLKNSVILIEGFDFLDDTSIQTLEIFFDKYKNLKTNFVFITSNEMSIHSKFKSLLRYPEYTEFVLKSATLDSCLSTIKSDASDFIQSFYFEKLADNFKGSYLYFQNTIKYLMETGVLINFENKLIIKNKKSVVLPKDTKNLYKSRIKQLGKNFDLSLILAYATILGPSLDFKTLEALELKDIRKNAKILEEMGLASTNSTRIFINNYNILNTVMKQSLKLDIEQFLAKAILSKLGKSISDTLMIFTMGILQTYKEEYLTLWKNSKLALNTGDFDAYLKNCLGFLSLIEQVKANIPENILEENKKEVYNNILITLYAYSPSKIYFIENTLLMDAINKNDNEKIIKLSNLMLQGALISSNYTDAQRLLHNILSRMENPTLLIKGAVNTKFLLLALVNIEILYNIGYFSECIEVAEDILKVLSVNIIEKIKPASFSINSFVSHIIETLRLVAFAKLFRLDNDLEDFFEKTQKALGVEFPEKDCIIAIKNYFSANRISGINIEESSAFTKIVYLILHEAEILQDNYKSFAQNIYQAKLLASDIHQKEVELFCDLLIAFAYSKISATEKAQAIYEDVLSTANKSALFNIYTIANFFIAKLLFEQNDYNKALLIVNDMLAMLQKNSNQAKIHYVIFENLFIETIKAQETSSINIEAEENKIIEFKEQLKNLIDK